MSYILGHNKTIKTTKNTKTYLKSNKILLNNVLDKDFQKMLLPFNLMHSIIFLKIYNIRDNFITPNSFKNKIVYFCFLMMMLLVFVYFIVSIDYPSFSMKRKIIHLIFYGIDLVFYPIAILFLYKHKVWCSSDNVKFILKLQEIDKNTKFSKNHQMFTVSTWSLGIVLYFHIFVMVINGFCQGEFTVFVYFNVYSLNMNCLFSTRIINLINNHIKLCTSMLKAKFENTSSIYNFQFEELHTCYMNILDAFKLFKETMRAAVRLL